MLKKLILFPLGVLVIVHLLLYGIVRLVLMPEPIYATLASYLNFPIFLVNFNSNFRNIMPEEFVYKKQMLIPVSLWAWPSYPLSYNLDASTIPGFEGNFSDDVEVKRFYGSIRESELTRLRQKDGSFLNTYNISIKLLSGEEVTVKFVVGRSVFAAPVWQQNFYNSLQKYRIGLVKSEIDTSPPVKGDFVFFQIASKENFVMQNITLNQLFVFSKAR